jgi:hypothetical protein
MRKIIPILLVITALQLAQAGTPPPPEMKFGQPGGSSTILDLFPPSVAGVPVEDHGAAILSTNFTPGGSSWHESLDEKDVFLAEMKHVQGEDNSFVLRIGRGGQVYSLRGEFGESIPPSSEQSPWNDEVWQFVAVCTKYNGPEVLERAGAISEEVKERFKNSPYQSWYFVHNSGAYMPEGSVLRNLYCPLLGSEAAGHHRTYRTVNWGLVPQANTIHRSPLLYYVQVRDVGDGIIELTWVVHNFSVREDIVFDHLNAPWGGTRLSSLPYHYLSTPAGELMNRNVIAEKNIHKGIGVRETGGWNISSASEEPDSPSLALVFGRDRHLEAEQAKAASGQPHVQFAESIYRDWDATGSGAYGFMYQDWETRPENTWRNYDVAVVIPKFRLAPGVTIWYRSFLVVNRKNRAIELAKSLVNQVDYGLMTFDPDTTMRVPVYIKDGRVVDLADRPAFELFAKPVPGTKPLFLIEHATTGKPVITSDPYMFVQKEKMDFGVPPDHPLYDYYNNAYGYTLEQNNSNWKRLLGFAYVKQPPEGSFEQLSGVVDAAMFPETDTYHLDLWVARAGGDMP